MRFLSLRSLSLLFLHILATLLSSMCHHMSFLCLLLSMPLPLLLSFLDLHCLKGSTLFPHITPLLDSITLPESSPASQQSSGTSVPIKPLSVSKALTPAVSLLSAPPPLVPTPGDKIQLEHPEKMNHLIPTLITGFQENATSSALNVVWRAHVQVLGKIGVVLGLSKAFQSHAHRPLA